MKPKKQPRKRAAKEKWDKAVIAGQREDYKLLDKNWCTLNEQFHAKCAELAAARDEAMKLREQLAENDADDKLFNNFTAKTFDKYEDDLKVATESHDMYIASYALHSKQVLAFLKGLPMDQKGVRFLTLG